MLTLSGIGTNSITQVSVNPNDIFTIGGTIGGSGPFTKSGSGTLVLTGNNTYTGPTTVAEGFFVVDGSIVSTLIANSGSTIKGTGLYGAITVNSGATLSPGNSIGPMYSDSVTFNPGSIFQVEIDADGSASILIVAGTATLNGGTVEIIQDVNMGNYPKSGSYEILIATGGITGSFNAISGGLPKFMFILSQVDNSLFLSYVNDTEISTVGLFGNRLRVANYLNENGSDETLFLLSNLSGSSLNSALDSISPARNAFGTYITEQTVFSLSNFLSTRLDGLRASKPVNTSSNDFTAGLTADQSEGVKRYCNPPKNSSAWIAGFQEFSHQSASLQNPSFNYISEAVLGGFDYCNEKKDAAGFLLGYAHTHFYDDGNAGHGNINYYMGSIYGNGSIGNFYLSPAVWGVFNQIENKRQISFAGYSSRTHANIYAWQLIPHLEAGYGCSFSWGAMTPFTLADWAISWQRGYRERGDISFSAKQRAKSSSMVRSETGLKFSEKWATDWGAFFLQEKASYIFEKPFGVGTVNTAFVGDPGSFTVVAVNQNLNLGSIGLNFLFEVGKNRPVKIEFGYEGEFGSHYWSNDLMVTISKDF
jgi:autotransporter-associated beta strand protein